MRLRKRKQPKQLTRAERAIGFIEHYCIIPEGAHVGKPVRLAHFQKKFFYDLFDSKVPVTLAIWSMARKNAKTATIAMLVLVFLVGPESVQNSEIVSGAMSRDQAAKVFDYCSKMIKMSAELSAIVKIKDTKKILLGLPMNVTYVAASADAKTAHGKSPLVVIMDELGQVRGPRSAFYEALETAQGAYENALMIIISTQAANDSDLLSILIDDALTGNDPSRICHLYAAPDDCKLNDRKAWRAANPALGLFRSLADVIKLAGNAMRMPSAEAAFRNLILNQRIETNSPLISKASWQACSAEPYPLAELVDLYAGLDLSGKTDLTALVIIGFHTATKTWNAHSYFWTPERGLLERSHRDRTPYDLWVKAGKMMVCPGATVDMEWVARDIAAICAPLNITAIAYDRWRIELLKKELEKIGVELPLVEYGQGFKDMGPAIDAIEGMIVNERLRHGGHPVLTMCASNAIAIKDPAGNRKLDKKRTTGRIDGMVAIAQAAGISERPLEGPGDLSGFLSNPVVV